MIDASNADGEGWGCFEDIQLLSSFITSHLDQWYLLRGDGVKTIHALGPISRGIPVVSGPYPTH